MNGTETATVLVVDDEADVADAYGAQLERDYTVITAYSGQEALERLDDAVDVVLLDRRMPGLSGDEVLEHIRDRGVDCRVAMVTAVDPGFDIIEMPFDDYIIKPVSREDLYETIERLLRSAAYEQTLREYYALSAKRGTLVTSKTDSELADSEGFAELEDRMAELQDDLDETVSGFDDNDFEAVFRDIGETPDTVEE